MKKYIFILLLVFIGFIAKAQPANDLCTSPTVIVPDGTCYAGTTSAATDNLTGEPGCATQGGPNGHREVWFSFTATTTTVEFDITSPSGSTIELLLISGTCAALTLENSTCQTSPLATTFAGLTIGQTYLYTISFPANVQSTYTTCVTSVTSPPESGQDCNDAVPICSNSSFGGNSDGYGAQELSSANQGCLSSGERQSSWYYFQAQTSGTLEMTIDPSTNTDYDFALWGPMTTYTCPVTGSPIRCSYAGGITTFLATGSYNTGFGPLGTEVSDGTSGTLNGWASTLNVIAGEFYILVIDNFSVDNTPFTLSWGGSSVLSCALLPVEFSDFSGKYFDSYNIISWTTTTETENKKFILERSSDAHTFQEIYSVSGAGNSSEVHHYHFRDFKFRLNESNYYRLKQIDHNGEFTLSNIIAINNQEDKAAISVNVYDMLGQLIDPSQIQKGVYIFITAFTDGSYRSEKKWIP